MDLEELKEKAVIVKQALYKESRITEEDLVSMAQTGSIDLFELYSRVKAIECLEKLANFKKEAFKKYASANSEEEIVMRKVASSIPRGITNSIGRLIYDLRPAPFVSMENIAFSRLTELLKD